jgi:hypothetical protein
MSVSISHAAICFDLGYKIGVLFLARMKRDWLLILNTFNVHYFFFVVFGPTYKLITIYSCNDDYHPQKPSQKHKNEFCFFL